MDSFELAKILLGKKSNEGTNEKAKSTVMATGTATSDSSNGKVMVDMGGDTISYDDGQSVEIDTNISVKTGDIVQILLTGAAGTSKYPVVIGVIGRGDEQNAEIQEAKATADQANSNSEEAKKKAEEASENANSAKQSASAASELATSANTNANDAKVLANSANTASNQANAKAEQAETDAANAIKTANTAQSGLADANKDISSLQTSVNEMNNDISDAQKKVKENGDAITGINQNLAANYATKTDVSDTKAAIESDISTTASSIQASVKETYASKNDVSEIKGELENKIQVNADGIESTSKKVTSLESDTQDISTKLNAASKTASDAQAQADTAVANAKAAQETADTAVANAKAADDKAKTAQGQLDTAKQNVASADASLKTAKQNYDSALSTYNSLTSSTTATEDQISAAKKNLDSAQAALNKALADVLTANHNVTEAQTAANDALKNATTAYSNASTALTNAKTAQDTADKAVADAAKANKDLAELTNTVNTQETKITQNSETISSLATRTTTVENKFTGYYTKTEADSKIKQTSDSITSEVKKVDQKIDDLQVGGRNLWLKTKDYDASAYTGWVDNNGGTRVQTTAPYTIVNGFGVQRISEAWRDISQRVAIEPNTVYTLSAWIKWESSTGTMHFYTNTGSMSGTNITSQVGTDVYKRVSVTFNSGDATISTCRFECDSNTPYLIFGLKFEKGNTPTDWSPAPEDLTSYTDSKIKQTSDSITQQISSVNNGKNIIQQINLNSGGLKINVDNLEIGSAISNLVTGTVNEYAINTSSSTSPTSGWSTTQPAWADGKYIWMRTKTTKNDGTVSYSNAACITGATGATGPKGKDGNFWVSKQDINLTSSSYNVNTWYPVVGTSIPYDGTHEFKVVSILSGMSHPSWSTHGNGFSVTFEVEDQASGWGTTNRGTRILTDDYRWGTGESPVSYTQLITASFPVFWLRGGGYYSIYSTYNTTWSIKTSTYIANNESIAPLSYRPAPEGVNILSTLGSKNKVIYSTSDPSSTSGYASGDVWFNQSTGGIWQFNGSAWTVHQVGTVSIKDGAITADKIVTHAVTSEKIGVGNLAAISADLGTVTAGAIRTPDDGKTFTLDATNKKFTWNLPQTSMSEDGTITSTAMTAKGVEYFSQFGAGMLHNYSSYSGYETTVNMHSDRIEVVHHLTANGADTYNMNVIDDTGLLVSKNEVGGIEKFIFTAREPNNGGLTYMGCKVPVVVDGTATASVGRTSCYLTSLSSLQTAGLDGNHIIVVAMLITAGNATHIEGVQYLSSNSSYYALFSGGITSGTYVRWMAISYF
ncbi:hypothetical protein ACTQ1O_06390 [Bilifractor sp. LCP21S3_A7]|uniref:hypothetical protein n=1 Tax=Bilifractor sp. LCP21S3_A7 TaxID=3438738 RepID=UPI003F927E71